MPVSHKYKAIFIHIPRTAGGTIERMLDVYGENVGADNAAAANEDRSILYGFKNDPNDALQHLTVTQIEDILPGNIFNTYFKFSIIRNPYDRILSVYFWRKPDNRPGSKEDFAKFLTEEVLPNRDKDPHYKAQSDFLEDSQGGMAVDFIPPRILRA